MISQERICVCCLEPVPRATYSEHLQQEHGYETLRLRRMTPEERLAELRARLSELKAEMGGHYYDLKFHLQRIREVLHPGYKKVH